jgi:hypothetical protein
MKGEKMNSLARKFMVTAVMSLLVTDITPAQRMSQPGVSRPAQSGAVETSSATGAAADKTMAPYGEMMEEDEHEYAMMMEMEMEGPYSLSRSLPMTGRKVYIIPSTEIKMEDHLAIERDITIMSHIFDRVLEKPQMLGGVFKLMDDFFGRGSHVTEVIFLNGYGAIFFMEVSFVLTGPPESPKESEPNEPKEQVDSIWKRAELELYTPPRLMRGMRRRPEQVYEPEKVEILKRNLVETLKHAANIQALKTDDVVILTVIGKFGMPASLSPMAARRSNRGKWIPPTGSANKVSVQSFAPTALTIRAKKSDIDAYSKGELDFDKFHERVQIFSHWK